MIKVIIQTSLGRALIYTSGHIVIAMSVVSVLTGASLFEAGLVALIEPTINGAWYYVLDKLWTTKNIQGKNRHQNSTKTNQLEKS